jgi:hypothetical protein
MSLDLEEGDAVPSMIGSKNVSPKPIPTTPPSAGLIAEEAIDPSDGGQVVTVDGMNVPRPPCFSRKFEGSDEASDFPLETAVLQGRRSKQPHSMIGAVQRGAAGKGDNSAGRKGVRCTRVLEASIREDGVASVEIKRIENPVNTNSLPVDVNPVVLGISVKRKLPVNQLPKTRNKSAAIWQRILGRVTSMQPMSDRVFVSTSRACRRNGGIKLVGAGASVDGARKKLGHKPLRASISFFVHRVQMMQIRVRRPLVQSHQRILKFGRPNIR